MRLFSQSNFPGFKNTSIPDVANVGRFIIVLKTTFIMSKLDSLIGNNMKNPSSEIYLPRTRLLEKSVWRTLKQNKDSVGFQVTPQLLSIARVETCLLRGARKYLEENDFVELIVPHITKATGACENLDTLFVLDYFGNNRFLSQTGQLHLEILVPFLKKVWCFGPSFRAEPKVDKRHLTEFSLIELEFEGDLLELIEHIEDLLCSMVHEVVDSCRRELELLGVYQERLPELRKPFRRITYSDAIEKLSEFEGEIEWGQDLKFLHELTLVKLFGDQPLFITHYPLEMKFFNMKSNARIPNIVNSLDLVLPFSGEAVGGAEREYKYSALHERLTSSQMYKKLVERGGSLEDFRWYLEFYRTRDGTPHSGCGIGLNRVTQFILGSTDIRNTTVFPLNKESVF